MVADAPYGTLATHDAHREPSARCGYRPRRSRPGMRTIHANPARVYPKRCGLRWLGVGRDARARSACARARVLSLDEGAAEARTPTHAASAHRVPRRDGRAACVHRDRRRPRQNVALPQYGRGGVSRAARRPARNVRSSRSSPRSHSRARRPRGPMHRPSSRSRGHRLRRSPPASPCPPARRRICSAARRRRHRSAT